MAESNVLQTTESTTVTYKPVDLENLIPIKEIPSKTVDDLTKNTLSGVGSFDRLMHAVELHIQDEYKKNRITGANYANVYTASLQYVLQFATQFTLSQDEPYLKAKELEIQQRRAYYELEKLKLEAELARAQLETEKVKLEIAKAQLEQEKLKGPYIKAQTLSELAKTKDIIPNDEECYKGEVFNVHGEMGMQMRSMKNAIENTNKQAALQLAKTMAVDVYTTIESAEGIGASYYALNGSNALSILNNCRKAFGVPELDINTFAASHKQYQDKYAPDVNLETDD